MCLNRITFKDLKCVGLRNKKGSVISIFTNIIFQYTKIIKKDAKNGNDTTFDLMAF